MSSNYEREFNTANSVSLSRISLSNITYTGTVAKSLVRFALLAAAISLTDKLCKLSEVERACEIFSLALTAYGGKINIQAWARSGVDS